MGKFDGVLLASDFDNTLLNTEPSRMGGALPRVSDGNLAALRYFTENGGSFAISTGRALAAFLCFEDQVPMNVPGVVCNGAALYDFAAGEYLETEFLDGGARARGQAMLDLYPNVACEAYHIDNVIHAVHPNEATWAHRRITGIDPVVTPSLPDVPMPLGKLLFEGDHGDLEGVLAEMTKRGWAKEYELLFSHVNLLEMTRRGVSKGNMVLRLARRLHIQPADICCIGDEINDLSMLRIAGHPMAPANCADAVRQSGAVLVADADHDALAAAVALLDRRY